MSSTFDASSYGIVGRFASDRHHFKMPAFLASTIDKQIEDGDKVILPNGILNTLLEQFGSKPLPEPMIFEVQTIIKDATSSSNKRTTHCGVLEFSSPSMAAFLPQWMMDNLGIVGGDLLQFRLKSVPPAQHIKFQPISYQFAKIPSPKLTLEHALRKFTSATEGDKMVIQHGHRSYELIVQDVRPKSVVKPSAVCLVNTNVEVEFDVPLENEPEDEQERLVCMGDVIPLSIPPSSWRYFRVKFDPLRQNGIPLATQDEKDMTTAQKKQLLQDVLQEQKQPPQRVDPLTLDISMNIQQGDGEVFVSTVHSKPNPANATWTCIQENNNSKKIFIHPSTKSFKSGWYYVAVFAYKSQLEAQISFGVQDLPKDAQSPFITELTQQSNSSTSTSTSTSSSSSTVSSSTPPPDSKLCSNCQVYVPSRSYSLHSAQCERQNWRCNICTKVMRKSEKDQHAHCEICSAVVTPQTLQKHQDLFHSKMTCDCGLLLELRDYDQHQKTKCPLRFESCLYCHVEMTFVHLQAHREECANKTISCERCNKGIRRKNMVIHLATEHGVNPSLRPDERHAFGQPLHPVKPSSQPTMDHSFIKREKGTQPSNIEFLSEDEQIAAALAQSLQEAPLTAPIAVDRDRTEYDDDAELQRALYESQRMTSQSDNKEQPSSKPAFKRGDSEFDDDVQPAEAEEIDDDTWEDEDNQSLGGDDDLANTAPVNHSDDDGKDTNKRHKADDELTCPYCDIGLKNYEALEKHLEICEKVDQ